MLSWFQASASLSVACRISRLRASRIIDLKSVLIVALVRAAAQGDSGRGLTIGCGSAIIQVSKCNVWAVIIAQGCGGGSCRPNPSGCERP